jgi:arylsulfatase A-like enzyme
MRGQSGMPDDEYGDGMIEHDGQVGKLLKTLDDLDIANDTIVVYTTDNGPHMNSWSDAALTPFRNEKNTNWEGAFRVSAMVRWEIGGTTYKVHLGGYNQLPYLTGQQDKSRAKFFTSTTTTRSWRCV